MISVIIPSYNSGRYICEAVDSVLSQSYTDYEIIVVDDGSTDNTRASLEKYKDSIRYIYQENRGLAGARNTGIKLAGGEYLQFLDADDIILPEKFEKQIHFLENNTHYDIVYCDYMFFDADGRKWKTERFRPGGDILYALIKDIFFPAHAPLFRREVIEKAGFFNEELRAVEDWEFWLRVAYCGFRFYFMGEVLCLYRQHESTLTKNRVLIMENKIHVIENASQKMLSGNVRKRLGIRRQLIHYRWLLGREYMKNKRFFKGILMIVYSYPSLCIARISLRLKAIVYRLIYGEIYNGSDIEAFLITTGERTELEAYNSIVQQSVPVKKITVLRDIRGIHNSLNAMQEKIKSEYFIKVDADMILHRNCVRLLYRILKKNPGLYAVQGYLKDPLLGKIWGIHMFRSSYVKDYRYQNTIGTDAEFEKAMERKGYRQIKYKKVLGIHHLEYTHMEIKQRFIREGEKIIFFKNINRLKSDIRHLIKLIKKGRRDAFYALVYIYVGLIKRGRNEKDFSCYSRDTLDEDMIFKDVSIDSARIIIKKCYEILRG